MNTKNVNVNPPEQSAQYKSIQEVLGKIDKYTKGTIFLNNNDGTATPLDTKGVPIPGESILLDEEFFIPFDPLASWKAEKNVPFWTIDTFGRPVEATWDGGESGDMYRLKTLIDDSAAFQTQTALQKALDVFHQSKKDIPDI